MSTGQQDKQQDQDEIAQRFQRFQHFKKYKARRQEAIDALSIKYLHLMRPNQDFPVCSVQDINDAWAAWNMEDEVFVRMTGHGTVKIRTFPTPPPEGPEYAPCRQMWACLIDQQVNDEREQVIFLRDAVDKVDSSPACKSHPPTCPCKVPNNPWTWYECVQALEPLGVRHNRNCECGGVQTCSQAAKTDEQIVWETEMKKGQQAYDAMMERAHAQDRLMGLVAREEDRALRRTAELKLAAIAAVGSAKTPEAAVEKASATLAKAEANLHVCLCDARRSAQLACICFPVRKAEMEMAKEDLKAIRVEAMAVAGTEGAAAAAVRAAEMPVAGTEGAAAAAAAAAVRAAAEAAAVKSPYDYKHNVDTCPCGTCHKARVDSGTSKAYTAKCQAASTAIATATATTAKGENEGDFAKNIFAAMGTPHDSLCQHGRPFYSCMPCSH
jgi:hypothetical protein